MCFSETCQGRSQRNLKSPQYLYECLTGGIAVKERDYANGKEQKVIFLIRKSRPELEDKKREGYFGKGLSDRFGEVLS
jgi:hypothetical protein